MDDAESQLVDKLKASNSVLVTVSRDPSVDQLSALLGLTILLNKLGKHAAAVFSGEVPSTLEFLQPDETIEKNTDSLRDFIIALDKNKADKLRYKVEDNVVRIFITPYRTSISQDDLEFSQGDFNIDLIVAIGVKQQEDLDEAITAHGRILHDATVASINLSPDGPGLGAINWHKPEASSLSEMVTSLAEKLGKEQLDEQIATALLTGIVAETDRFSNAKTSSQTMSASAVLMAAGANQQLVASKLNTAASPADPKDDGDIQAAFDKEAVRSRDGEIAIDHDEAELELPVPDETSVAEPAPAVEATAEAAATEEPVTGSGEPQEPADNVSGGSKLITEPPTMGGVLTANASQNQLEPTTDPLSMPASESPLLDHQQPTAPPTQFTPPPDAWTPPAPPKPEPPQVIEPPAPLAPVPMPQPDIDTHQTLSDLEQAVDSPHAQADLGAAREQVDKAITSAEAAGTTPPQPTQALNALPVDLDPSDLPSEPTAPTPQPPQMPDPTAPPPVPPPIPFQFGNTQTGK